MPGSIGTDPMQDGVRGDTQSSGNNGVVGTNASTSPIPTGQPGGNGVFGFTANPNASGVFGTANAGGTGIAGFSIQGDGTRGDTQASGKNGLVGTNSSTDLIPTGQPGGNGVFGFTQNPHAAGVFGTANAGGTGLAGFSTQGDGTRGDTQASGKNGLVGTNSSTDVIPAGQPGGNGVWGFTQNPHAAGVFGTANAGGTGLTGFSTQGDGTRGDTQASGKNGVVGTNSSTAVIPAGQPGGNGVYGFTQNPHAAGVLGVAEGGGIGLSGNSASGIGIYGSGKIAGHFDGNVEVTGSVTISGDVILPGADCAEEFDMAGDLPPIPGAVMVIDDQGALALASEPYDFRVAGVISGAGTYRPALTLDRRADAIHVRGAIALIGKAWCQVDASQAPIRVGDLLTTSATPGHAMRADRVAPGTILGKALAPFHDGTGLIPMLITLQ